MKLQYTKKKTTHTHSDFDDLTMETVQHNYNITSICRGISSIVPENVKTELDTENETHYHSKLHN